MTTTTEDETETRLLKGCIRFYYLDGWRKRCGKDGNRICPTCQAKLEQHRQTKAECRKEELEWLEEFGRYAFLKNRIDIIKLDKRIKELQKADEMFKEEEN